MSINVNESPEIYGVFETGQYDRSKRQQVYQQAEISSSTAGQRISFSMPPISSDLRDMYLELNVELNNITPEISAIFNVVSHTAANYLPAVPTGGLFYLDITGDRFLVNWNDTKGSIIDQLNDKVLQDFPIKTIVYSLVAPQLPTDLFSATGNVLIEMSGFGTLGANDVYSLKVESSQLFNGAGNLFCSSLQTQLGVEQFPQLEYDSSCLLRRAEIEMNAQTFSECDDINVLMGAIIDKTEPVDWYNTIGRLENNTGLVRSWTGQKRFAIKLDKIFGMLDHYYPLNLIPGVQLRINLFLEQPDRCLVQDAGGAGSYTVFNPELHYHALKLSSNMRAKFQERIDGDGLVYGFRSYQNLTDTLVQNATERDIITNYNFSRFTGIVAVMREQSHVNDPTQSFKLTSTIRNNIGSYRLKIGTQYYPRDRVQLLQNAEDVVEPFKEYTRFYNLEDNIYSNNNPYGGLNFEGNSHAATKFINFVGELVPASFIMAISTDPHQNEEETHNHSSGVDVSGQTNVSLELRNVQTQETNIVNLFARYNAFAVLQRNQSIYIR